MKADVFYQLKNGFPLKASWACPEDYLLRIFNLKQNIMKILKFAMLSLCIVTIFGCEEDNIRSLIIDDGRAPGSLFDVAVENVAGGSKLTYNLPDDSDLLYVEAQFKRNSSDGTSKVRSSVFNNNLMVEGFGEEKEYEVSLYAVDQSENRSEPVFVTIKPEKAPFTDVFESLEAFADFGGIHLFWENPFEGEVSIEVYANNEVGVPKLADVIYTAALNGDYAIRGFDTTERDFTLLVKDRFNNLSDRLTYTIKPLFEQLLDRSKHVGIVQIHDSPTAFGWDLPRLFDGIIGRKGFHTAANWSDPGEELPEYIGENVQMFTVDLGVLAKISRVHWLQRGDTRRFYQHGNPRIYDIWGTDELNADGSLTGWVKMVDNEEVIKPSGSPSGTNTPEDLEAANAGEDAVAISSAPPVRYIRFVNKRNWGGTTFLHIMEMQFYGQLVE